MHRVEMPARQSEQRIFDQSHVTKKLLNFFVFRNSLKITFEEIFQNKGCASCRNAFQTIWTKNFRSKSRDQKVIAFLRFQKFAKKLLLRKSFKIKGVHRVEISYRQSEQIIFDQSHMTEKLLNFLDFRNSQKNTSEEIFQNKGCASCRNAFQTIWTKIFQSKSHDKKVIEFLRFQKFAKNTFWRNLSK